MKRIARPDSRADAQDAGRDVERPRLCVQRSPKHIRAQVVDDSTNRTIVAASSLDGEVRKTIKGGGNIAAAKVVGKIIAERAHAKGVDKVVYDRGGYQYQPGA